MSTNKRTTPLLLLTDSLLLVNPIDARRCGKSERKPTHYTHVLSLTTNKSPFGILITILGDVDFIQAIESYFFLYVNALLHNSYRFIFHIIQSVDLHLSLLL